MGSKKLTPEQKWREQAEAFKRAAEKLPYGKEREELLRKASQLETASHINEWVSSPGLSPPSNRWLYAKFTPLLTRDSCHNPIIEVRAG